MTERAKPVLLIDLSSIFWPNWMANEGVNPNPAFTWSMDQVRRIASKYERVAVCCDPGGPNWRHDIYPRKEVIGEDGKTIVTGYKAQRPEIDQAAIFQLRRLEDQLKADGFPVWRADGFEADDLIASAAAHFESLDQDVVVFSADKDLCQLVTDELDAPPDAAKTILLRPSKGNDEPVVYDAQAVFAKFGVPAWKFRDFLALCGDKSDNVPGVRGCGPKMAAALLTQSDDIEGILQLAASDDESMTPRQRQMLIDQRAELILSRKLVSLKFDVSLPYEEVDAPRKAVLANESESLLGMGEPDPEPEAEVVSAGREPAPVPRDQEERSPGSEPAHVEPTPTTTALATVDGEWTRELEPRTANHAFAMAKALFASRTLAGHPNPESIWSIILTGREFGLGAMTSLRNIYAMNTKRGVKVTMSASMMQGLVLRSGEAEYFVMVDSSDTLATYETKRKGDPRPVKMSWSIEDARRAGLLQQRGDEPNNWAKYPRTMLRWRCVAELARAVYPDVICNVYAPEELADV